jgi:hypothetical protein
MRPGENDCRAVLLLRLYVGRAPLDVIAHAVTKETQILSYAKAFKEPIDDVEIELGV